MISQATGLLELHHGIVTLKEFSIFFLIVIVFINSWMIQMVYTNRYGEMTWTDIGFSFVNMAIILYMSNSFIGSLEYHLTTFFITAGLLSLTLCFQYVVTYIRKKDPIDRDVSRAFIEILAFRAITLLIGGFFYNKIGITIALLGILISWILPAFTGKYTQKRPIIFSHLIERLTALIIVIFGETIIGIADYFTRQTLSFRSILIFVIVATLFFSYITEFDHLIKIKHQKETGNLLIYLHYFILFGLILVTKGLEIIHEEGINFPFVISLLYGGILLMYIGIGLANYYNKENLKISLPVKIGIPLITLIGYLGSLACREFSQIIWITAIVVVINTIILVRFYMRRI